MCYRRQLATIALLCPLLTARADSFDQYVNATLSKAAESADVQELKRLTSADILRHDRVLPGVPAAVLIVKTNEGRWAKLTVQSARQKIDAEKVLPMLLVERYVTYREGEERTIQATGQNVSLFPGFRLSLDLGQVVPEQLGGDLRFVVDGDKIYTETVGKARLFLLTKAANVVPAKNAAKLVIGETFEPRYFNGTFKLHDDGRRSGTLKLEVAADGGVTGSYYSDKDGQKYEVRGKIGSPAHAIHFTIVFPRAEQTFQGMLFTGDARAMAGTSRMAEREAAFYATRVDE